MGRFYLDIAFWVNGLPCIFCHCTRLLSLGCDEALAFYFYSVCHFPKEVGLIFFFGLLWFFVFVADILHFLHVYVDVWGLSLDAGYADVRYFVCLFAVFDEVFGCGGGVICTEAF